MKLKPDTKLRNTWFTSDAMSHPAKGHLGLWWEILERYTEPGQWVIDPMAGIGSTLMACLMGRNVICNEMEQHFIEPMAASWAKMQQHGPMLGHQMGQALIIRGDARMLPIASADCGVTSPPYEAQISDQNDQYKLYAGGGKRNEASYTRPVSAVLTSPPYDEGLGHGGGQDRDIARGRGIQDGHRDYVDAVVTSPPFGGKEMHTGGDTPTVHGIGRNTRGQRPIEAKGEHLMLSVNGYADNTQNIGNQRGAAYWQSMTQVYRECHRVLIPGGVMALVVKGYTRNKKYVDLPGQTADLIETLGFSVFGRWTREVPLSFWRTLQKQNGNWDEALRFEHVIAARKVGREPLPMVGE